MKYLTEKQVIEKYKEGYRIEPKKNYKDEIVSYWMWKKGEDELRLTKHTRESLYSKGIIDSNNDLTLLRGEG